MKAITIMLAAASLWAPLAGVTAQEAMPEAAPPRSALEPTFDASAHVARLDELRAKGDYTSITAILDPPANPVEANANLDWLGLQFRSGTSAFFSLQYSRYLQAFAEPLPEAQGDQLRGTALAALVHAIMVAQSDSQQCADATARGHTAMRLVEQLASSGLTELDPLTRKKAGLIALRVDELSWDQRKRIDDTRFLCAGGMNAMLAGLAQGTSREVDTPEGQVGRTIAVTPPGSFAYERVPDETWWPVAERYRERNLQTAKSLLRVDDLSLDADQ